jgi:regulatory LuxR family protein
MRDLREIKITARDERLRLLAQGCSNKEIAAELQISPRTVKQHLRTLFLRAEIREGRKRVRNGTGKRPLSPHASLMKRKQRKHYCLFFCYKSPHGLQGSFSYKPSPVKTRSRKARQSAVTTRHPLVSTTAS